MGNAYPLAGRSILVVEDEPLIALDIAGLFESAGAKVRTTKSLAEALELVAQDAWSGAVLDYRLGHDDVRRLCQHLGERGIPFMFYTGLAELPETYPGALVVHKPATGEALLARMSELVSRQADSGAQRSLAQIPT
jgi:DNA-binding response OmpR family regulator